MVIRNKDNFDYALGLAIVGEMIEQDTFKDYLERYCDKTGKDKEETKRKVSEFRKRHHLTHGDMVSIRQWVRRSRLRDTVILPERARDFVENFYEEWKNNRKG